HQGVDALRTMALEVVATEQQGIEVRRERAPHDGDVAGRDEVGHDGEALLADRRDLPRDGLGVHGPSVPFTRPRRAAIFRGARTSGSVGTFCARKMAASSL